MKTLIGLGFCWFVGLSFFGLFPQLVEAAPPLATTRDLKVRYSWTFRQPMIAFLGFQNAKGGSLSSSQRAAIRKVLKKRIESRRLLRLETHNGDVKDPKFVQKMVQLVVKKSWEIASVRARWSAAFQGRDITTKFLTSVQNNSFFYWVETTKGSGGEFSIRLFFYRLNVFDCTEANQRRSKRHRKACVGKKPSAFAGVLRPFARLIYPTKEICPLSLRGNRRLFSLCVQQLDGKLLQKSAHLFPLHAPIVQSRFRSFGISLGIQEGLRLNQALKVYVIHKRGYLVYRGFARVTTLGDNRTMMEDGKRVRLNEKAPFFSRAHVLMTRRELRLRRGMVAREYPMFGFEFGMFAGAMPMYGTRFADVPATSSVVKPRLLWAPSLSLSFGWDVSHNWGISGLSYDGHLEIFMPGHTNEATKETTSFAFLFTFGMLKRFLWRQTYWLLGLRPGFGTMIEGTTEEGRSEFQILLVGGDLVTGVDFLFNPHVSFSLRLGFRGMLAIRMWTGLPNYALVGPWVRTGFTFTF